MDYTVTSQWLALVPSKYLTDLLLDIIWIGLYIQISFYNKLN